MHRLRSLDFRRIQHFVVLAETLNFSRAADRLHMAQPPLSVSIRKLESELGAALFVRRPQGVSLTPTGNLLLPHARKIISDSNQLFEIARDAAVGARGTLRIGFVGSSTYGTLQRVLSPFREKFPNVQLVLREATSARIVREVGHGEMDIGLVRTPLLLASSVALIELERDALVVALPIDNPLVHKPHLSVADLAHESFIMYSSADAVGLYTAATLTCEKGGFLPRIAQEAIQIQTVLSLVESGLGVALVPSVVTRHTSDQLVYRRFDVVPSTAHVGLALAYLPDNENAAVRNFCDLALQSFG
ncbi:MULTISPECIES: LysR family transcriptional regulator [Cupriavidus]|uniref:LysR family transcriptional regulator n=1 Tax=Cupriavidus TaxID=106589 RepID=UPI00157BB3B0|nr:MULTISPECIES: LysR family transcriptional regulator [Cupriavidus]MBB1632501.1 LysR family transcriptional regulator [Cupriavidus sp. UME77]NUA27043.1 LysR family transcriptional regulator [Cupriavidus basilensis]